MLLRSLLLLLLPSAAADMSLFAIGDWGGQKEAPFWTDTEVNNAAGMAAFAASERPRLGLLMGDNFYARGIRCDDYSDVSDNISHGYAMRATRGNGRTSGTAASRRPCAEDATHHRFIDTFEKVWDAPSLLSLPMYVIPGNHDYYSQNTMAAEIEYGQRRDIPGSTGRWRFPVQSEERSWYDFTETFDTEDRQRVDVHFFMLDTVKWVGLCNSDAKKFGRPRHYLYNTSREWYVEKCGGEGRYARAVTECGGDHCCVRENWTKYEDESCASVSADEPTAEAAGAGAVEPQPQWWVQDISCNFNNKLSHHAAAQREWLEGALAASKSKWKVVVGHHPVWSVSDHGPSPRLVRELKPLLQRYKVAFYLNGHDHNAQHISTADNPETEYITAGAGSPVDPRTTQGTAVTEGAVWRVEPDPQTDRPALPIGHDLASYETPATTTYHAWEGDPAALKFFWAERGSNGDDFGDAGDPSFRGLYSRKEENSSFATIRFVDAERAYLDLVAHTGCVIYRYEKPNPNTPSGVSAAADHGRRVRGTEEAPLPCYPSVQHTPQAVREYEQELSRMRAELVDSADADGADADGGGGAAWLVLGLSLGGMFGALAVRQGWCGESCSGGAGLGGGVATRRGYEMTVSDEEQGSLCRASVEADPRGVQDAKGD